MKGIFSFGMEHKNIKIDYFLATLKVFVSVLLAVF